MKILFICSSLEPGRDGVGDYTRRLVCELIKQGNEITAVAINDKFIIDNAVSVQENDNIKLTVLRLASLSPLSERLNDAQKYIDDFNPDWISLQFVIFGFHPKGLPLWLNKLATLAKGKRWHIMFHELWIGMANESPVKQKYWGLIQKCLIKRMVAEISPAIITTQSNLYKAQLAKNNINAYYLPLFGNVPVVTNKVLSNQQPKNDIAFVVFGTIHPNSPIKQFIEEAVIYKHRHNVNIIINIIGKSGGELSNWLSLWRNAGFVVKEFGEQPVEIISEILLNADIGISTSAYSMIEKSGTVAAMREHGLNVICVANQYRLKGVDIVAPDNVFEYKKGDFEMCISDNSKSISKINANYVAQSFTALLKSTSK